VPSAATTGWENWLLLHRPCGVGTPPAFGHSAESELTSTGAVKCSPKSLEEAAKMYPVPSSANVVHVTYTRSRNGLPGLLSTVMSGLSSRKSPAPARSACSATGRPGKLNDAPPLPVERWM
jgi:hypothetical protein